MMSLYLRQAAHLINVFNPYPANVENIMSS